MWSRREAMKILAGLPFTAMFGCAAGKAGVPPAVRINPGLTFNAEGATPFGKWQAQVTCSPSRWRQGAAADLLVSLLLSPEVLPNLGRTAGAPEAVVLLVTSERSFDASGTLRLPSHERMSTLLTPAGLAIEGGSAGP